jgi:hypothetical protein
LTAAWLFLNIERRTNAGWERPAAFSKFREHLVNDLALHNRYKVIAKGFTAAHPVHRPRVPPANPPKEKVEAIEHVEYHDSRVLTIIISQEA